MKRVFSYIIVCITLTCVFSQQSNKDALQKKNKQLMKEIAELEEALKKNSKESTTSLLYLNTLNEKLTKQEKLVNNVQKEKIYLDDDIYIKQREINQLNSELKTLRLDFKDFLIQSYKRKSLQNKFLFIFSAKSLSEIYRRIYYLKIFSRYQNKQAREILQRKESVEEIKEKKKDILSEKEDLLDKEKIFKENLESERQQQETVLLNFEKNKSELTRKIRQNQNERKRLESEIQKIIKEEIRIAKEKAEAERKAREAELAKLRAEEEARRQREAALAKLRAEEEAKRKAAEMLALKKAEEDRLRKEEELARIRLEEEAKRKTAQQALLEEESKDIRIAENALRLAEEKRIAQEKELARIKALEDTRIAEAKKRADLLRADEQRRLAEEAKKRQEYENKTASSVERSSNNFALARGTLPSPLLGGTIVSKFGKNPHPALKNIEVDNRGVDIAGARGSKARAVFDGTVTAIYAVPGGNKAILVQHGSYFTLYHNLSEIYVSKGDKVKSAQNLGKIYTDSDGNTILNFQVWRETTTENPEGWLRM